MTEVDFNQLTPDNGAIRRLSELLLTTAFAESDLSAYVNLKTGQKQHGKLDWLDRMSAYPLFTAGGGCKPTYGDLSLKGIEKSWDFGEFSVAKAMCYTAFQNTIAEYALKRDASKGDMTTGEIMDYVILPVLASAMRENLWLISWFADKNAANISDGGVITDGVDVDTFKMANGLFARLFAIVAADATKHTAIAANTAEDSSNNVTYASQKAAMYTQGAALAVLDNVLSAADPRIKANGGKLFVTSAFFDAFVIDYDNKYHNTIPFENVANGVVMSKYHGVDIVVLPEWDRAIQQFQNSGTALNLPYRVVFASPENLFVGTSMREAIPEFDIWFERKDRTTNIYGLCDIDTNVGEDDLVQVAY